MTYWQMVAFGMFIQSGAYVVRGETTSQLVMFGGAIMMLVTGHPAP